MKLPEDKFPHVAVDSDGYMEPFTPAFTNVVQPGSRDKISVRITSPNPTKNIISHMACLSNISYVCLSIYLSIHIHIHIHIYRSYSTMHPAAPEGFSRMRRNPSASNANDSQVAGGGHRAPRATRRFFRSRAVTMWRPVVTMGVIWRFPEMEVS